MEKKRFGCVQQGQGEVGGGNHAQNENVTSKAGMKKREREREGNRSCLASK